MDQQTQTIVIGQTLPNERLDTYLHAQFPTLSRGTLQRLIAQGDVRVNGQSVKPAHRPRAGEEIGIHWPEAKPSSALPESMPLTILFEDADLLVLDKAAGLVVHPAAGHEEHTLVNALLHHCQGTLSGIGGVARPGIVHRLDKDTSGCMVVAKNDSTHLALATQFAQRTIEKLYLALVCGRIDGSSGEIRAAIARHPSHRKRMAVNAGNGRDAWTSYRVIELLSLASLVEARPHTGRTHQVRVHFHHIGYPLVGDDVYGKRANQILKDKAGALASRQMLHAAKLTLIHPGTGKTMSFAAPLPNDFRETLAALQSYR